MKKILLFTGTILASGALIAPPVVLHYLPPKVLEWTKEVTKASDLKFNTENKIIGLEDSFNSKILSFPERKDASTNIRGIKFDDSDTGLTSPKKAQIEEVWFPKNIIGFELWGNFFQGMTNLKKVVYGGTDLDPTSEIWGKESDGYASGWSDQQFKDFESVKFDLYINWTVPTESQKPSWFGFGNWAPYGSNIKNVYVPVGQNMETYLRFVNFIAGNKEKPSKKNWSKSQISYFEVR